MSVHFEAARNRWVVRWRQDGRNRSKRVASGDAAEAFDESVRRPRVATTPVASISHGDGIHAYGTTAGVRFRFVFRQSDGTMSSRRGFTSRQAATAARRRLVESIERGEVKVTRESFGTFWAQLLRERRPYLTAGSFADVEAHRRKRLMPAFEHVPLARMDEKHVRAWVTGMAQRVESGKISAKTINNARTCLAVALNEACRRGLIARNPCDGVPPLPVVQEEIDYLRLAEIEPYLGGCADFYRPLAETLLGTGARISEATAIRWPDLDLVGGLVRVCRQRSRDNASNGPTKGRRFRPVQIGPRLCETLRTLKAGRREAEIDDGGWVFLCPRPKRGRYAGRSEPSPPHRKTVHDWHESALVDAGIRDMPLHSLRHTAAASWLTTGHPLIFVQRQLGHRSITTTERYYGHLELSFVEGAAARTEQAIIEVGRSADLFA